MVAALNCWWPDGQVFRTTDGGKTWAALWAWQSYPTLSRYYAYDDSLAPWIGPSGTANSIVTQTGWMMESLVIDPFDSNHWLYGTGETIYGGHDLLNWDTKRNVTLKSLAKTFKRRDKESRAAGAPKLPLNLWFVRVLQAVGVMNTAQTGGILTREVLEAVFVEERFPDVTTLCFNARRAHAVKDERTRIEREIVDKWIENVEKFAIIDRDLKRVSSRGMEIKFKVSRDGRDKMFSVLYPQAPARDLYIK